MNNANFVSWIQKTVLVIITIISFLECFLLANPIIESNWMNVPCFMQDYVLLLMPVLSLVIVLLAKRILGNKEKPMIISIGYFINMILFRSISLVFFAGYS